MYQCTFFYTANRMIPENRSVVVAAWSVTADQNYVYNMAEDTLLLPKMYCFIRTIEGSGVIRTTRGDIELEKNAYILIPRKEILSYRSNFKIWSYYWVDFVLVENLSQRAASWVGKKMVAEFTPYEQAMFQELLNAGTQHPDEILYINGIFSHYFFHLYLNHDAQAQQEKRSVQFSEICAYVEQKIYSHLTVQEIADFFGVSSRRIHQIFRENAGISPKQYISDLKMEKAGQLLLHTSTPIVDIAEVLGYNSPYHFSSVFRKKAGCSPSAYRNGGQTKKSDNSEV